MTARTAALTGCGGIWGYAELLETLSDPSHPEHDERREWLGVDDVADLAPELFDATAVNQLLSAVR